MNVSAWSIKNPIPAVMLFVMLTFAGLLAFKSMKVQQFPDLELPTVTVSASLPGAAPAQLETEVARKLENAIAPLQGLKNIYTKVQDGGVTVTAEFRLEKPTQEAVDDVRSAVQGVRSDLPSDVRDPVVSKVNLSGAPILAITIRSPKMDDEALSWFVDNTVARRLLGVKGVGSVVRVGGVTREVRGGAGPAQTAGAGRDRSRHVAPAATRCKPRAPAAAPTWVAASSPCARWPRSRPWKSWHSLELTLSQRPAHPARPGGQRARHRGRAARAGPAQRRASGWVRDHPQQRRQRGRGGRRSATGAERAQSAAPRH